MTKRVDFTVDGKPQGKGRPRFTKGGRSYTPAKTVEAEKAIAWAFKAAAPGHQLWTGSIRLLIVATFEIPRSWSRKYREAALNGDVVFTGKPDRDNIEKLVADALNGVAWMDDAQVTDGRVVRRYGMGARIDVTVEEIEAQGRKSPAERRREAKRDNPQLCAPRAQKPRKTAPRASVEHAIPIGKRIR